MSGFYALNIENHQNVFNESLRNNFLWFPHTPFTQSKRHFSCTQKSDLRFIINGDWQARCLHKESHFQLKSSKKYIQVSSIAIVKLLFVPHNKKRERKMLGQLQSFGAWHNNKFPHLMIHRAPSGDLLCVCRVDYLFIVILHERHAREGCWWRAWICYLPKTA